MKRPSILSRCLLVLAPCAGATFPQAELTKHPDFHDAGKRSVGPRPGIPVDALEKFLDQRRPLARDAFSCDSP